LWCWNETNTKLLATTEPADMIAILDDLYSQMDMLASEKGIYKVETIGDAYFAVCG
jgi:class 3 adenylate cyclase